MATTPTEVTLGTLAVLLKLEGRDFLNGLDKNSKKMVEFSKVAEERAKTIGKAVGIATGAIGAGVFALKGFAAQASSMQAMAQTLGVTVERFQELKFAADQTGVSMETLLAAFTRTSQYIGQVASGQVGPATEAFKVLGISIRDASGAIKDTNTVFGEIADKFASFKDGAEKSALAVGIFGEQGAKLMPLLNQGSGGIEQFAGKARELGIVLGGDVVSKAADVDKELKVLTDQFKAAGIELTAQFLPAVKELAKLVQSPEFKNVMGFLADSVAKIVATLNEFNSTGRNDLPGVLETLAAKAKMKKNIDELTVTLNEMRSARDKAFGRGESTTVHDEMISNMTRELTEMNEMLKAADTNRKALDATLEESNRKKAEQEQQKAAPTFDPGKAAREQAEAEAELERQISSTHAWQTRALNDLINAPTETAAAKIDAITAAVKRGTVGFYEFGQMQKQVSEQNTQHMDDMLTATSQVLTSLFAESKTAAIAAAIINTYQGITKALASYPPPISYAMAAATAAMGFAQVRAIKSQGKTSSGGGAIAGGGASGGGAGVDAGGATSSQTLFINGIRPGDLYSGVQVRELADQLIQYQRDGGTIILGQS